MTKISKVILMTLILSMNTSVFAFAASNDKQVLENEIFNHMKNWETKFSFTYNEKSALDLLQDAAKKDDYLERSISLYKTSRVGVQYEANIDYRTTKDQEKYINLELEKIVNNLIDFRMTEAEKVESINNYLVKIYKYDYNYKSDNAYSAMTTGRAICQGYAMTAYKMFKIIGIECRIINGDKSGISHAWNLVKINGSWYHLDITNNDNVVRNKYLLKSDSYMKENGFIWNSNEYPTCQDNYYKEKTEYIDYNNDKETDIEEYYNGGYWYKESDKWYYKRVSGYLVIGWFKNNNQWYYMNNDGAMQTGWINPDGNWYYCWSDGTLAINTTIDGYKLNENGVWIS